MWSIGLVFEGNRSCQEICDGDVFGGITRRHVVSFCVDEAFVLNFDLLLARFYERGVSAFVIKLKLDISEGYGCSYEVRTIAQLDLSTDMTETFDFENDFYVLSINVDGLYSGSSFAVCSFDLIASWFDRNLELTICACFDFQFIVNIDLGRTQWAFSMIKSISVCKIPRLDELSV
ncbi:MAG TPA: hypothetical protein PKX45_03920, partial [Bacillota bacterium]|nr:hypothetical protein [Bacillota bacterium]